MSWHGVQSRSSIGAHAGMAAKVLRALAAVLVDSPAKAVKLKEHRSQQRVGVVLPAAGLRWTMARPTLILKVDGWRWTVRDICVP